MKVLVEEIVTYITETINGIGVERILGLSIDFDLIYFIFLHQLLEILNTTKMITFQNC